MNFKKIQPVGIITFVWLMAPLFVSFLLLFILLLKKIVNVKSLFIFLALTFALINYTKTPQSDLIEYFNNFQTLIDIPLSDFSDVIHIDFGFYFISMLIGKISDNVHIILAFWTFVAYYFYFKSLELINKRFENKDTKILLLVVFFAVTMGLLFSQSSHLVRQFSAVSLLIYAFVLRDDGFKKKSLYVYFFALNVHFSLILFLPILLINKSNKEFKTLVIAILLLIVVFFGENNILIFLSSIFYESNNPIIGQVLVRMSDYVDKNNGDIQLGQFIKLGLFFILSFYLFLKSEKNYYLSLGFLYLIIILVLLRNTDLILIRYYMYSNFFYALILLIYLKSINNKLINIVFLFYCLYGLGLFLNNIYNSSWTYISNDISLFYTSFFSFLNYWS